MALIWLQNIDTPKTSALDHVDSGFEYFRDAAGLESKLGQTWFTHGSHMVPKIKHSIKSDSDHVFSVLIISEH